MNQILYLSFLFFSILTFGQARTVSGNVISIEDGLPIPGVTVLIHNSHQGTSTDFDGNYSLKNVTPKDTLVFSYIGMKTQKICAKTEQLNVNMQEDIPIEVTHGYPIFPRRSVYASTMTVTAKDLRNADNPKYNFKKNAKNNVFVIFVSELTDYNLSVEELEFQEKYKVKYSLMVGNKIDYLTKYNKLTFKHLKKKYKKSWQAEIRKDAIGLEKFLN